MKILLTGATGFIGTNFVLQLHKKYKIIALVRKTSNVEKIKDYCKIYYYDGTINSIENIFKKEKIDGVVHLAAVYKPIYNSIEFQEMFVANLSLGIHILESCKMYPLKFFVNTITFSQFANSTSYNPKTLYDAMKQAFFDVLTFYSKEKSNTIFTSLMLFNPYGIYETTLKIFSLWSKSIKNKKKMQMGDGKQKIDVTYISDVVKAYDILIELCINKQVVNGRIYSAENKRYTIRELASIFEKNTNTKLQIEWNANLTNAEIIQEPISYKTSKIIFKLPKWKPEISLVNGMKMVFENIVYGNINATKE
ncbi:NAD-dependent epimerase/dehydratase family protein [Campylobacter jejuni]|nr:NAD(P)-dependent oxidoreductase [Campylobacter jejuni]HDZ4293275.1 NAD-dependent epimerase/dehydratase family protein [Campylobacter jejuni]HED7850941.1 NAD-dependent epimerase/dehydratase family protein [Campylobacter jejuni]HED8750365.1 NAD-dependent epimerase/dehydratase family protein [Campylobacter jejuni]HEF2640315.1 NAD-dependent epimerase/dehydratase family protein [Campylobacter jejuni]